MNFNGLNLNNIGGVSLRCKAMPGVHIVEALREGLILSLVNKCEVDLEHNGRVYTMNPNSSISMVMQQEVKSS